MGTRQKPNKHGLTGTDIYRVYRGIKFRCTNKTDYHAKYYVDKGITLCEEWFNNPKAFCDWALSHGYKKGLTIDRIDNTKGYSPENCRFVDIKTQCNNRSNNVFIEAYGKKQTIAQWSEETGIGQSTLRRNVAKGFTGEQALKPEAFHKQDKKIGQYDLKDNLIKIWNSLQEIQNALHYSKTPIANVCKNKKYHHTAHGYKWKYIN